MDLNYLYHRRGVATLMSHNAACEPSRDVHRTFARAYGTRIVEAKHHMRAPSA